MIVGNQWICSLQQILCVGECRSTAKRLGSAIVLRIPVPAALPTSGWQGVSLRT
jgi:hypothetical protein